MLLRQVFTCAMILFAVAGSLAAAENARDPALAGGSCSAPAEPAAEPAASALEIPDYVDSDAKATLDAARKSWSDYRRITVDALSLSGDPRDLAAAAVLSKVLRWYSGDAQAPERSASLAARASDKAPDDVAVQWVAVHLSSTGDDAFSQRARVRLQHLEPENGAVWFDAVVAAQQGHDDAGAAQALARLASSTRFDEHVIDVAQLLRAPLMRYPMLDPSGELTALGIEIGAEEAATIAAQSFASMLVMPPFQDLSKLCDIAQRSAFPQAADCAAAGRLMALHSDSLIAAHVGFGMLRVSQTYTPEDQAAARADAWIMRQFAERAGASRELDTKLVLAYHRAWVATGSELAAMRKVLVDAGAAITPPDDWIDDSSPLSEPHLRAAAAAPAHVK